MPSIETHLIGADEPKAIEIALSILRAGGLIAFPTDTVYGLGALAMDAAAVASLYLAKSRPPDKSIPVLLGDTEDMRHVAADVPPLARQLAARFWPGPLTLIIPRHPSLPESVSASTTVGVRVPDHGPARALLRAAGPMAVTSANISGAASPSTAGEVMQQLQGRIPLIIDGGRTSGGVPSTVVDCTGLQPVILRPGTITLEDLTAALPPAAQG